MWRTGRKSKERKTEWVDLKERADALKILRDFPGHVY